MATFTTSYSAMCCKWKQLARGTSQGNSEVDAREMPSLLPGLCCQSINLWDLSCSTYTITLSQFLHFELLLRVCSYFHSIYPHRFITVDDDSAASQCSLFH